MYLWLARAVLLIGMAGCNFTVAGLAVPSPDDQSIPDLAITDDLGFANDLAPDDLALPPLPDLSGIDLASGPLLIGSVAQATTTPINLTTEGSADWSHWGFANAMSYDHKNVGTTLIGNVTLVGASQPQQNAGEPVGFSWTDGTPTPTATNTTTAVYVQGNGNGFSLSVSADASTIHTLRLYAGGQKSTCTITATLSDNSAPMYRQAVQGTGMGPFMVEATLVYRAASPGQHLNVSWSVTSTGGGPMGDFGHIASATLQ
jgi:hypothetical protein